MRRRPNNKNLRASSAFDEARRIEVKRILGLVPSAARETRFTVNVKGSGHLFKGQCKKETGIPMIAMLEGRHMKPAVK